MLHGLSRFDASGAGRAHKGHAQIQESSREVQGGSFARTIDLNSWEGRPRCRASDAVSNFPGSPLGDPWAPWDLRSAWRDALPFKSRKRWTDGLVKQSRFRFETETTVSDRDRNSFKIDFWYEFLVLRALKYKTCCARSAIVGLPSFYTEILQIYIFRR
jgi:hypothetical protein